MSQNNQPTIEELQNAWTEALSSQDIIGARGETREALIQLRKRKTTWVGEAENNLRFALDNYLGQYCRCPDGPYHYPQCPLFTDKNTFAEFGAAMGGTTS